MRAVYQTKATNCVAACVASILDMDLEDIPDFNFLEWGDQLRLWLKERGFGVVNMLILPEQRGTLPENFPDGFTLGGVNTHKAVGHCVVCKDGYIYFDPSIGFVEGRVRPDEYTIIYPLEIHRLWGEKGLEVTS